MRISHDGNTNIFKLVTLAVIAFSAVLVASCGGGGSSDSPATDAGTATSGGADAGTATSGGSDAGAGDTGGETDVGIGGTTSGNVSSQGLMTGILDITRVNNFTSVRAEFRQYSDGLALTLDGVLSAIEQPLGTCRISPFLTNDIPDLENQEDFFDFESIDAGEVVTVTSPAGTWLSLIRGDISGFITYQAEVADGASLTPVPDDLTVDVPGADDYPAFTNVAVGNVAELSGISLANNAQLTWDAGSGGNEIELAVSTLTASFEVTYTYCRLADTGSFELPASVQASIEGADEFTYSLNRIAKTVVRQGNAAFAVVSRSKSAN